MLSKDIFILYLYKKIQYGLLVSVIKLFLLSLISNSLSVLFIFIKIFNLPYCFIGNLNNIFSI